MAIGSNGYSPKTKWQTWEEFGAAIPEEDAEKLTTVGKVVEYLKSKGYGEE